MSPTQPSLADKSATKPGSGSLMPTTCAPVSAALLIWGRRWVLAVAALGLTIAAVAVQLPLFLGSDASRTAGVDVRVISANIYEGTADPQSLVEAAQAQADVIAFQELTPQAVDGLSRAGLDATFPYRWLDARGDARGVGMWSRFPIEAPTRVGGFMAIWVIAYGGVQSVSPILLAKVTGGQAQSFGAKEDWPAGLDLTPDGRTLVVALNQAVE